MRNPFPETEHERDAYFESMEREGDAYFESMVRERTPSVVHGLFLAIGFYSVFGVLDGFMFPGAAAQLFLVRLVFILTALVFIILVKFRHGLFLRRSQPLFVVTALVAGAGILAKDHLVSSIPHHDVAHVSMMLAIVFTSTFFPIRFVHVVLTSVLLVVAYNLSFMLYPRSPAVVISNNGFLISCAVVCCLSCRNSERLFLQKCRDHALISRQKTEIEAARRRTDELLRQILPESIARRILAGEAQIADGYADVTVLFADLSGFTTLSTTVSPQALVRLLNRVFSGFDEVAGRVGAEKIKTIGDGYMAVCGAPNEVDDHPDRMIRLAVGMMEVMEKVRAENPGMSLAVRIGIHTGPCVAGIIGKQRFAYDLWGDAVNLASRMESTGVPGKIQVSEATYLRTRLKFAFEARHEVEVKGRGRMAAYLLGESQHPVTPSPA